MPQKPSHRMILSQGDLDGACFLYSIVNAFVALTGELPKSYGFNKAFYQKWDEATEQVPYLTDFLMRDRDNANSGTGRYNDDVSLLKYTISNVMSTLSDEKHEFEINNCPGKSAPAKIAELINESSVLIACPRKLHWLVLVAYDPAPLTIYAACSSNYLNRAEPYEEHLHASFRRYYNRVLPKKPNINGNLMFAISIKKL